MVVSTMAAGGAVVVVLSEAAVVASVVELRSSRICSKSLLHYLFITLLFFAYPAGSGSVD